MKLIGICGFIGSGKNTVADYISQKYEYQKVSFAAGVKDAVSVLFNWDRKMLEGDTEESRKWRETPDTWWTEAL